MDTIRRRGRPPGSRYLADPNYTPSRLLNWLLEQFGLNSDAALASELRMHRELISKLRNRRREIGAPFLLSVHERYGVPVKELRHLAGLPSKFDQGRNDE